MSEGHAFTTVSGNLGRDPETRQAGQSSVTRFSIGVGKRRKQSDGQYSVETNWYEANVWSKRGEALAKFLHKGSYVTASGDQFVRAYQTKDGQSRFAIELDNATVTPGPKVDGRSEQKPAERGDGGNTIGDPNATGVPDDNCPF